MKFAFILSLALAAWPAYARSYPTRPIRMVVPQPAGGTMDTVMRALGEQMSRDRKSTRLNSSH